MELTDYCQSVETELSTWESRLQDMSHRFDRLGSAEREKILPNIEDLNIVLSELGDRIADLKHECPTEWSPIREEIDDAHINMRGKYEETMAFIGRAAPVSVPG